MEKEIPLMERIRKEKTERKKQVISEFENKAQPLWKLQEKLLNKIKPLLEERDTQLSELDNFIKKEFIKKYKEIVGKQKQTFSKFIREVKKREIKEEKNLDEEELRWISKASVEDYLFHCFENQPDGYIMKWLEDFVNHLSSEEEKKEVLLVLWKLKHS
jgi:hypothetical protein